MSHVPGQKESRRRTVSDVPFFCLPFPWILDVTYWLRWLLCDNPRVDCLCRLIQWLPDRLGEPETGNTTKGFVLWSGWSKRRVSQNHHILCVTWSIDPESTAKICQVGDDGVARWEFNPHKSKGGSETEVLHMCKISGGINPLKRMNRKP